MGSMALLRCKRGKREGDNPYITCTEEGIWTEPEAHCILRKLNDFSNITFVRYMCVITINFPRIYILSLCVSGYVYIETWKVETENFYLILLILLS